MGAGGWCSWICIRLGARLEIWSEDIGGGVAEDSQAGYNLLDDAGRNPEWEPDISWISAERLASVGGFPPRRGYWNLCPAFVVEVVSPNQSLVSQQDKMVGWLHFGVELGWLIDPESRTAWNLSCRRRAGAARAARPDRRRIGAERLRVQLRADLEDAR